MKTAGSRRVAVLCGLLAVLLLPAVGWCGPKIYYHLTVKAFFDPHDPEPAEWAWVTLVEVPKTRAFPTEAATAARLGGRLRGSVLAFVRGSAWRSAYHYTTDTRCHDRPAKKDIFWRQSVSESLYAGGGLDDPDHPERFSIHITTRPIFLERDGWFDPKSGAHAFLGPIGTGGGAAEEMRGDFIVRCVNFEDQLTHYRRCGKAWVEQYRPALCHFQHQALRDEFGPGEDEVFGQLRYGPHDEKLIVYDVIRSSSREHPHWQRQEM